MVAPVQPEPFRHHRRGNKSVARTLPMRGAKFVILALISENWQHVDGPFGTVGSAQAVGEGPRFSAQRRQGQAREQAPTCRDSREGLRGQSQPSFDLRHSGLCPLKRPKLAKPKIVTEFAVILCKVEPDSERDLSILNMNFLCSVLVYLGIV